MRAEFTYYIFEGVLIGTANGKSFHISAASGGGGGTKDKKLVLADSTNNPYSVGVKEQDTKVSHVRGGPIPPGKYSIGTPAVHKPLGLSAQLLPTGGQPMYGRSGFYIHGRGPKGSDGCIVPLDKTEFVSLMDNLKRTKGGVLFVEETTDGDAFA